MTRPPEKPVPVSERDREMAAALLQSVQAAAWAGRDPSEPMPDALARARHEGRLEGASEMREQAALVPEAVAFGYECADDTMAGVREGARFRNVAAAIRALALPEGETRT